jgi:murein DD-endopeptidase MepM/ murein hydrolase activator NlpD
MRQKLLLTLALAALLVVAVVWVGAAGAADTAAVEGGSGEAAVEATVPAAPTVPAPPSPEAPACSNGIDDDGDGLTDGEDPSCTSPEGTTEAAPAPTAGSTVEAPPAAPAPAPEAVPGEAVEAGPSFHVGASIGGGGSKGVTANEAIGAAGGGVTANGAIGFPSATAGHQPPPTPSSGGAQYSEGGAPTPANPTTTIATFGAAPLGVPNFVIDSFEIPPFLLPIYQACGTQYGIPWEVLAAINKIETGFGTNLNVSSAGAVGWMQFIPSSWRTYGLDANGDGREDPYNPVDAICAAAHYLHAAGGSKDLYRAVFAYNHADWYVQEVLTYARSYGRIPARLVGSLTGLTQGAHFPIAADARYADEISTRAALERSTAEDRSGGNAADVVASSPTRRGINIYSHQGAPVVAVNDGIVKAMGKDAKLGRYIVLEDTYGNRYTYANLGPILHHGGGAVPNTATRRPRVNSQNLRPRLFALPARHNGQAAAGRRPLAAKASGGTLKVGSSVVGGAVLARVGPGGDGVDPHIDFEIHPAGRGAATIDPKPILDGWKLLEATAIYRARGKTAFSRTLGVSGVLLLSKEALQERVLHDAALSIYSCGRADVASGQIDRRVLALLEYLTSKGYRLAITSLKCGHSVYSSSGFVSEHSTGDAVDIATIDGVPVVGHQGPGTLADQLIKSVLALQGTMHPHQVISLEDLPGETSFAMADHYDHVHIGYTPGFEAEYVGPFLNAAEGRIDQGVDFTGTGPILAIGNAEILQTGAPGWPEGGGVLYRLLDGPRAGQVVFVYEGVQATVHAGQRVSAGQQIANFVPGGSIEIGFADASGVPLSHAEYSEGLETTWGKEMAAFLASLGSASPLGLELGGLSANKWERLSDRLDQIENPTVPAGPSKYSVPAGKGKGGRPSSGD